MEVTHGTLDSVWPLASQLLSSLGTFVCKKDSANLALAPSANPGTELLLCVHFRDVLSGMAHEPAFWEPSWLSHSRLSLRMFY